MKTSTPLKSEKNKSKAAETSGEKRKAHEMSKSEEEPEVEDDVEDGELTDIHEGHQELLLQLANTRSDIDKDPQGKAISEDLIPILEDWWQNYFPPEKITDILQKVKRPKNASCLIPTMINPDVFRRLPKRVKDADTTLQYIGNVIYKAGGLMVQSWAMLMEAEAGLIPMISGEADPDEDQDSIVALPSGFKLNLTALCKDLSIAVQIMGMAAVQIGQRRSDLKSSLDEQFHPLCDKTHPVHQHLFPTDLQKEIDDISKLNKITKKIVKKKKPGFQKGCADYNQHPYFLGNGFRGNRGYFRAHFAHHTGARFWGRGRRRSFNFNRTYNNNQNAPQRRNNENRSSSEQLSHQK